MKLKHFQFPSTLTVMMTMMMVEEATIHISCARHINIISTGSFSFKSFTNFWLSLSRLWLDLSRLSPCWFFTHSSSLWRRFRIDFIIFNHRTSISLCFCFIYVGQIFKAQSLISFINFVQSLNWAHNLVSFNEMWVRRRWFVGFLWKSKQTVATFEALAKWVHETC